MKKKITPVNEVFESLSMLPLIEDDINLLKNKYQGLCIHYVSPYKLYHVSKHDFITLIPLATQLLIHLETNNMKLVFGSTLSIHILIFTPIDAELLQIVINRKFNKHA